MLYALKWNTWNSSSLSAGMHNKKNRLKSKDSEKLNLTQIESLRVAVDFVKHHEGFSVYRS